jgi:hypothetical protein
MRMGGGWNKLKVHVKWRVLGLLGLKLRVLILPYQPEYKASTPPEIQLLRTPLFWGPHE